MSTTTVPTMIVEDIELRVQPSLTCRKHPMDCDHVWEPLWGTDHARCIACKSLAHWIDTWEQP